MGNHLEQAGSIRLCHPLGGSQRLGAQTSCRVVDNPQQAQIVRRVIDDPQVGKHILDFRPVKESGAADDPVGNAVAFQRKFHGVGLGVGAVQDGKVPEILIRLLGQNLPGHIVGFRTFVGGLVNRHRVSGAVVRPQLLPFPSHIVGNYGVGGIENGLGGAVVLLQANHSGSGVLLLKAENVLDGSSPEAVDTLVIVTHHANVPVAPGQQGCEQVLGMVGILVLVHQYIAEFPLIVSTYLGKPLQ